MFGNLGHPCSITEFRGTDSIFSLFQMMLAMIFDMSFYLAEVWSLWLSILLRHLSWVHNGFIKTLFCFCLHDMIWIIKFTNVAYYIRDLLIFNHPHIQVVQGSMVKHLCDTCLDFVCKYFMENFLLFVCLFVCVFLFSFLSFPSLSSYFPSSDCVVVSFILYYTVLRL